MSEWPYDFNVRSNKDGFDFEVEPIRSKPHYKAKRIHSWYYSANIQDRFKGNGTFMKNRLERYRWYTSNGNIYGYTLKQ